MASRGNPFGNKGSQGDTGGDSSVSVAQALSVLRRAADSPRAQSALKTLENELDTSSKSSSSKKAPGGDNSPFGQRMAKRSQGSATAQKGAA